MAEEYGGRRRWQLVLAASPLQGHVTPMLQLATCLHSKGFSITIAHSEFNRCDPSNHPDFKFLLLSDHLSGPPGKFANVTQLLQAINDNCKPHLREHLIGIIKTQKERYEKESIVVIHDDIMFFAGSVARDLGLPSIIMQSSSAALSPAVEIISQLHKDGRLPVQDSLLQEIVPDHHPFRYKDLPFIHLPVQHVLQLITMITPKSPPSAFIWNTLEFLEPSALSQIRQKYHIPIFTIGPLHKITSTPSTSFLEEDTSCIAWLDQQTPKSVIYVSIGSIVTIDEKVAIEMAWGLANSNQPFLWVVRPGSVRGFEWIEFLPDDLLAAMNRTGLIVKWAPQKEVLAHIAVGGFWSHCGWNSTLESISEGVPMLCQPFDADQLLNARYLTYVWKIGVEIVVEKAAIEGAIRKVLVSKEGDEMRQREMEVLEKVQDSVSHGGSSHNSLNNLVDFVLSL